MTRVSIAIASMGRDSLAETLKSFKQLEDADRYDLDVVIADDSKDGAVVQLISQLDLDGLPVRVLDVHAGNISVARNALLDAITSDWLVFVDDDEWVDPAWLAELFSCAETFQADVVVGPVLPQYPAETPEWMIKANPLYTNWGKQGQLLKTGRGGNTLVHLAPFKDLDLRFDPGLGKTGGEDTDFFGRAAARGIRIVACDTALAFEHVPVERTEPRYILSRAVRSGQSYGHMELVKCPSFYFKALFCFDAALKFAAGAAVAAGLRLIRRATAFRFRQKAARNLGKLRACAGLPLAELYKNP